MLRQQQRGKGLEPVVSHGVRTKVRISKRAIDNLSAENVSNMDGPSAFGSLSDHMRRSWNIQSGIAYKTKSVILYSQHPLLRARLFADHFTAVHEKGVVGATNEIRRNRASLA